MNRPIEPGRNSGVFHRVMRAARSVYRVRSLAPTHFGRGGSAARHEQEVGGAFHESGGCSVGLLEPLKFIVKLVVEPGFTPPRATASCRRSMAYYCSAAYNKQCTKAHTVDAAER